jgi:Helix-turn-helix domain of transposase family ISL3
MSASWKRGCRAAIAPNTGLSVAVLWAREGGGFTLLFEALALLLCGEMPMAAVADALGEHDTRLWRVGGPLCRSGPREKLLGEGESHLG